MKEKNSPLSKVSHLANNSGPANQTEKETSPTEAARKYWESVTRRTSQGKTTLSNAKEDQTKASRLDSNCSENG